MSSSTMTPQDVLNNMRRKMGGQAPRAIELAADALPEMVLEQARSSAFAMPPEGGALDEQTRTLIYLGIALATGSQACVEAMLNKAGALGIDKPRLLETFKIARYAEATRVVGNAEHFFERMAQDGK